MTQKKSKNTSIYFITITALMTALVYVFTAFINIRLPIAANGGLIHLGNVPLSEMYRYLSVRYFSDGASARSRAV